MNSAFDNHQRRTVSWGQYEDAGDRQSATSGQSHGKTYISQSQLHQPFVADGQRSTSNNNRVLSAGNNVDATFRSGSSTNLRVRVPSYNGPDSRTVVSNSSPKSPVHPVVSSDSINSINQQDFEDDKQKKKTKGLSLNPLNFMKTRPQTPSRSTEVLSNSSRNPSSSKLKIFQTSHQKSRHPSNQSQAGQDKLNTDDDNISLMPTLAIGFENSIATYDFDKQPQPSYPSTGGLNDTAKPKFKRKRKELRITDEGYYFAFEAEAQSPDIESPEFTQSVQLQDEDQQHEQTRSAPYQEESPYNYQTLSPHPPSTNLQDPTPPATPTTVSNTSEDVDISQLVSNVPVISQINQLIDSFDITQEFKLLIKVGVVLIVLYEIQNVLEIFYELFSFG